MLPISRAFNVQPLLLHDEPTMACLVEAQAIMTAIKFHFSNFFIYSKRRETIGVKIQKNNAHNNHPLKLRYP
jgi:hypothetical protein